MKKNNAYTRFPDIWISKIPAHWQAHKMKRLFVERSEKGHPNEPLLVASQKMGVVPKNVYGNRTVEAQKDLHLLKLVRIGDFVISLRSFQGGLEYAYYQGIISPAYTILIPHEPMSGLYFRYLAKSKPFIKLLTLCVTGIREGQNIDYTKLKNHLLPAPPREEQDQIVRFLDWKVSSINRLINIRKKETKELKVLQSSIISQAVTQGLNPNVLTKSSGVKWNPQIPATWNVARLKTVLQTHFSGAWGEEPNGNEDCLCIRIADFRFDRVCVSEEIPTLRRFTRDQVEKKVLQDGDLLLEKSGGGEKTRVGRVVQFIDKKNKSMMCSNFIECLRPNATRANSSYLTYLLKALYLLTGMNGYFKQTIGIQNVDMNAYLATLLPVPPREEQEQIVHFIENKTSKILKLIEIKKKEILELENYKTRLIADVVTGQMDIRNITVPEYEYVEDTADDGCEEESEAKEGFYGEEE